jgi:hypothetical protein
MRREMALSRVQLALSLVESLFQNFQDLLFFFDSTSQK